MRCPLTIGVETAATKVVNREFDNELEIIKLELFGSRANGTHRENSDVDIKLEYKGDYREDDVFNGLHGVMRWNGLIVDFFPVRIL